MKSERINDKVPTRYTVLTSPRRAQQLLHLYIYSVPSLDLVVLATDQRVTFLDLAAAPTSAWLNPLKNCTHVLARSWGQTT